MQTHVKKNSAALLLALLLPLPVTMAQNAPAPANPPPANNEQNTGGEIDNSVKSMLDYNYNHQAGDKTAAQAESQVLSAIADKIKALDVLKTPGLDNPEVRARFETYISLPAVSDSDIKDYFNTMSQVSDHLKQGDAFGAWKLLYALSDHRDLDAGISRELANRVEGIWNSDRTQNGLAQANDQLRDNIDTYDHNADMIADDLHQQALQERDAQPTRGRGGATNNNNNNNNNNPGATNSPFVGANGGPNPNADPDAAEAEIMPTMSAALERKMELTNEYLKLLEARAKIKTNEIRADQMNDEDRQDFADYIKMLYQTHRYYHVIIAADFYRVLFNVADSDMPDAVNADANTSSSATPTRRGGGNPNTMQFNSKPMGISGAAPVSAITAASDALGITDPLGAPNDHPLSISEEVTAALEINNRVNQAVEVFKYKAGQGDIAAAADQLQEAFLANEYHPALQGLDRDEKEKVGEFLDKINVLKNQLEVRDFEQVEGQIADIKKIASDFDSTKPMALVNAVKLESRLRIGKAKLLAEGGALDDSMKEFATAAEEWPGNPDLQNSASAFFNSEDTQNESTADFDRLVKEQNYRAIFDKQLVYATAVHGDATREQQLKDALTTVQKAEMAAEKANMLMMNGDIDGAWETIELATKDWPDDTKLNKLLATLSERGSDFVSAVNKARDAEAKKELGYSLTWYINAQSIYPASTIANEGIDRLSKQILSPPAAADPAGDAAAAN
ncbi:MAG TPA: hypothetical protein VL981_12070 [Candidatus Methylacidiphilales bacterium]|nr:hypothetical protein [Candidatus Methylacidiphilales bacterium]